MQTYYAGSLGDKLTVHVCLLPVDTTVYGNYYYGAHGAGLAIEAEIAPAKTPALVVEANRRLQA